MFLKSLRLMIVFIIDEASIFSMNCLVYEMSQFAKIPSRCPQMSFNVRPTVQRNSVYNDINQRKTANPHIGEAGTSKFLTFLHKK